MKKILAFILAVLMLLSFCACAAQDASFDDDDEDRFTEEKDDNASEEKENEDKFTKVEENNASEKTEDDNATEENKKFKLYLFKWSDEWNKVRN